VHPSVGSTGHKIIRKRPSWTSGCRNH